MHVVNSLGWRCVVFRPVHQVTATLAMMLGRILTLLKSSIYSLPSFTLLKSPPTPFLTFSFPHTHFLTPPHSDPSQQDSSQPPNPT